MLGLWQKEEGEQSVLTGVYLLGCLENPQYTHRTLRDGTTEQCHHGEFMENV